MMKTTHMKYMGYAIAAAVLLLYGCVSERDTVSVRQVESKAFIVLRAGEGRKNIFSLKYPLAFEFRKNVRRKIYYFDSSYFAKNDELCPGTGECRIEANDNDEYLTDKYKKFEGNVLYTIEGNDTMQRTLSEYCRAMLEEKKDTIYNPQIQISAESGTKRSIFRQKNKTKRSKKRLHTTLIKPEQKVNEDLCSGFILS